MSGPTPDGGGRGGGGFDNDPTLVVSPVSPYNLGNVSSTVPTDFVVTLKNQGGGTGTSITVSGINFSSGEWTCTEALPFTFARIHTLHLRITPVGLGAKTVTLTINNDGSSGAVTYVINAVSLDPFAGGIVHLVSSDPDLPVGQMPTAKTLSTSGTQVGVENVGSAAFDIVAAAITVGGTWFALTPPVVLPITINFGDPPTFFPIVFSPDDIGVFNGTLRFTTDLLAPQLHIDVPLSGLSVPFFAVSVLDNANRVILFAFDGGEIKFIETNNYDYGDRDSFLEFNGTLWSSPGQEKTLERLEIFYENIGVSSVTAVVTVLRPSQGADHYDVVQGAVTIGTAAADGTDRSAYIDITASGEIMFLSITRLRGTGPCALTAIIPHFADRGEKVENV